MADTEAMDTEQTNPVQGVESTDTSEPQNKPTSGNPKELDDSTNQTESTGKEKETSLQNPTEKNPSQPHVKSGTETSVLVSNESLEEDESKASGNHENEKQNENENENAHGDPANANETAKPISVVDAANALTESGPSQASTRFQSAWQFLEKVRARFQDNEQVYDRFLKIMEQFKYDEIDKPGVMACVAELFSDHTDLMLGFNSFLPPGYEIGIENGVAVFCTPEFPTPCPMEVIRTQGLGQVGTGPYPMSGVGSNANVNALADSLYAPPGNGVVGAAGAQNASGTGVPVPGAQNATGAPIPGASDAKIQQELDHAKNFVKKIKYRFETVLGMPMVYREFLLILKDFHNRERGDQLTTQLVYEKVAELFKDHLDLLEEFSQFLPEMDAAAANHRAAQNMQNMHANAKRGLKAGGENDPKRMRMQDPFAQAQAQLQQTHAQYGNEFVPMPVVELEPKRPSRSPYELGFFYQIREGLGDQRLYYEFLKICHLFTLNILNRAELLMLGRDLLSRSPHGEKLTEKFSKFIDASDTDTFLSKTCGGQVGNAPSPFTDLDFTQLKRLGPSYRALPKTFRAVSCSGRDELCKSVLNDTWVSVPTGSEEASFKNSRKNQYEEELFNCEDERFELDLVIALNAATMRALEKILVRIRACGSVEKQRSFRLSGPLDILHIRSIERLYYDKGPEIIDHLFANPSIAIPVILRRLQQKDQQWRAARVEWSKIWRQVNEKNYWKSLDHQSFYFKLNEKKVLNPRSLIGEISEQRHSTLASAHEHLLRVLAGGRGLEGEGENGGGRGFEKENSNSNSKSQADGDTVMGEGDGENGVALTHEAYLAATNHGSLKRTGTSVADVSGVLGNLCFAFPDPNLQREVWKLLSAASMRYMSGKDREKMETFLECFLFPFLKDEQALAELQAAKKARMSEKEKEKEKDSMDEETSGKEKEKEKEKRLEFVSPPKALKVFFGNDTFYVFFRLFQILCERLAKAHELAEAKNVVRVHSFAHNQVGSFRYPFMDEFAKVEGQDVLGMENPKNANASDAQSQSSNANTDSKVSESEKEKPKQTGEKPHPEPPASPVSRRLQKLNATDHDTLFSEAMPATLKGQVGVAPGSLWVEPTPEKKYEEFFRRLLALVSGQNSGDASARFENDMRDLFGIDAYVLFTMDKVVYQFTRQLQCILTEEESLRLLGLYSYESLRTDEGHLVESVYRQNAIDIFEDDEDHLYRFVYCPPKPVGGEGSTLHSSFGSSAKVEKSKSESVGAMAKRGKKRQTKKRGRKQPAPEPLAEAEPEPNSEQKEKEKEQALPPEAILRIDLLDQGDQLVDLIVEKKKWIEYVSNYLSASPLRPESEKERALVHRRHLFLLRNLPRTQDVEKMKEQMNLLHDDMEVDQESGGERQESNQEGSSSKCKKVKFFDGVTLKNGLECKICMHTYRMYYVEHSEDFFFRRQPPCDIERPSAYTELGKPMQEYREKYRVFEEKKLDAFNEWLKRRLADLQGQVEEYEAQQAENRPDPFASSDEEGDDGAGEKRVKGARRGKGMPRGGGRLSIVSASRQ